MKILNLKTNNVFDLPKEVALNLIKENPEEFVKGSKPKKIRTQVVNSDSSILSQILDKEY